MADSGFPLPVSSYKELIKIIQGYGRFGKDASLGDIAALTAMNETGISGNNKFLLAAAIIQGGKRKTITSAGAALANALEHDLPEEVSAKWRAVVDTNDFLQKVLAAVRIRKGMDESSLESHVAYSAGQPKTPVVSTGAGTVVEILKKAGYLKDEGGNIVATVPAEPVSIFEDGAIFREPISPDPDQPSTRGLRATSRSLGGVQLTIDVTVQCTPADLNDLGHKLRKVIHDFNEAQEPQKNTPSEDSGR